MILCENCLETVEKANTVPVGPDKGSQRDPYQDKRTLCDPCGDALVAGRWDVIHERYSAERQVRRDDA